LQLGSPLSADFFCKGLAGLSRHSSNGQGRLLSYQVDKDEYRYISSDTEASVLKRMGMWSASRWEKYTTISIELRATGTFFRHILYPNPLYYSLRPVAAAETRLGRDEGTSISNASSLPVGSLIFRFLV
jgi:hypothetical protein